MDDQQTDRCNKLVNEVNQLTSLPSVCLKIMELTGSAHSTARDIEFELKKDPALATQVLRMANSAFYGLRSEIDTLSRAVSIIGIRRIANLVLAISTMKSLNVLKNDIVSIENFWSHSISCGVIASKLAKHCGHRDNESFFVAGLLHDIGQLVLFSKRPAEIKQALERMQADVEYQDFHVYENEVLGYDHTQVGLALARKWDLPATIQECIAYHHEPTESLKHPFDVSIVHIANMLANLSEVRSQNIEDAPPINPITWKVTNLTPETCLELLADCHQEYEETQAALLAA